MTQTLNENESQCFYVYGKELKKFPKTIKVQMRKINLPSNRRDISKIINHAKRISDSGLLIQTQEKFNLDCLLEVCLTMEHHNRNIHVLGRVIWTSREVNYRLIGVHLYKLDQEDFSKIILQSKRGLWVNEYLGEDEQELEEYDSDYYQ